MNTGQRGVEKDLLVWHNSKIANSLCFYKMNLTIELPQHVLTKNFSWTHCFSKAWEISSFCFFILSWITPVVFAVLSQLFLLVMLKSLLPCSLNPPSFFKHQLTIKGHLLVWFIEVNKWNKVFLSVEPSVSLQAMHPTPHSLWSGHCWWSAGSIGAKQHW